MATIFQTKEWEDFKLKTGYQKSWRVFDVLVLEKKIPLLGSMLYAPVASHDQTKLATQKIFQDQIKKIAKESKAIFFRLESGDEIGEIKPNESSYQKAFEEMQPEHSLILDISKSEEEILAQMKPKGRYNIKVAEKHGIKVSEGAVEDFYLLYKATAGRQKISYRNISYFQNLIDNLGRKDYVKVFVASASNQPSVASSQGETGHWELDAGHLLASAIVVFYGKLVIYLFGGSSQEMRNTMAPYKLHWEIIKEAKKCGCNEYDFFGVAPESEEKHPWAGVSRFKRQFGGREITTLGSWDMIFSPTKYWLFKIAEKIRRH